MSMNTPVRASRTNLIGLKPSCSTCSLADLCLPLGLPEYEINRLDSLIDQRQSVEKGGTLYFADAPFSAIYAIRRGFFKTSILTQDGREQVTGFHMTGDILGVDAISTERYNCDATALEDSEVCIIPFANLESLLREVPSLQRNFHRIMSREIVRDQSVMLLLGNMSAEERLATFLVDLSRRHAARGFSATSFHLRMTRTEIGSFMGMRLETISRTFARLQEDGYVTVHQKLVVIEDLERLKKLSAGQAVVHARADGQGEKRRGIA